MSPVLRVYYAHMTHCVVLRLVFILFKHYRTRCIVIPPINPSLLKVRSDRKASCAAVIAADVQQILHLEDNEIVYDF